MCKYDEVILMFDGGIREGLTAVGYLAVDPKDDEVVLFSGSRASCKGTSNLAEYRALIAGLRACLAKGVKRVNIFGDSQLIVKQVRGDFKVNKPDLRRCREYVIKLLKQFQTYSIEWIPRQKNKRADALVNKVFKRKRKKWEIKKEEQKRRKQLSRRQLAKE